MMYEDENDIDFTRFVKENAKNLDDLLILDHAPVWDQICKLVEGYVQTKTSPRDNVINTQDELIKERRKQIGLYNDIAEKQNKVISIQAEENSKIKKILKRQTDHIELHVIILNQIVELLEKGIDPNTLQSYIKSNIDK